VSTLRPARRALPYAFLGLFVLLASIVPPSPVHAASPVSIPQGPVPVDAELKPVQLGFTSIDCTVSAIDGGVALDTRTRTGLKNPDRKASYERQVTFPGLPVSDVKVGTVLGGVRPADGAGPWTLSVRPDGDAVIEGTQRTSASGPLVELNFDWGALQAWGSGLGSGRLTLHFPQDLQAEQLLVVDPEPTARSTVDLTWSYEKVTPDGQVRVLFIVPPYWRAVRQARQATSDPQAGAAEFLSLADALRPLVEAEGMPPETANALQAQLLSALRRATAVAPQEARSHTELAAQLQSLANGDAGLLAEAVSEFKAAYDLAPGDASLKKRLLSALDGLMAACRQVGDSRGLLAALDMAEAVEPQGSQERAAAYAELIVGLLEEGRIDEAHATIAAGFGQAEVDRYAYLRPHFSAVHGEIETQPAQRLMRFTLVPAPGVEETAERDLASLVEALGRLDNAQVKRTASDGQQVIEVTVPYPEPTHLQAGGQSLTASLPEEADPALLVVAAAAAPSRFEFRLSREAQADRLTYAENADLSLAQDRLNSRLEQLEAARLAAEEPSDDPLEAAHRRWVHALLQRYEADWQALVTGCRVTYDLLPPEDIIAPRWSVAWGEQRSLAWSTTIPRLERLVPWLIGGGLAALVAVVGVVVWKRRVRYDGPGIGDE
jgi:hypothetical protein